MNSAPLISSNICAPLLQMQNILIASVPHCQRYHGDKYAPNRLKLFFFFPPSDRLGSEYSCRQGVWLSFKTWPTHTTLRRDPFSGERVLKLTARCTYNDTLTMIMMIAALQDNRTATDVGLTATH